jgi:hypothetical protein
LKYISRIPGFAEFIETVLLAAYRLEDEISLIFFPDCSSTAMMIIMPFNTCCG